VGVVTVLEETTTLSGAEVEARRPGMADHRFRLFGFSWLGSQLLLWRCWTPFSRLCAGFQVLQLLWIRT